MNLYIRALRSVALAIVLIPAAFVVGVITGLAGLGPNEPR